MNIRSSRWAVAAMSILLGLALSSSEALAQGNKEVAGTWSLVSSTVEKDGQKIDQFGPGAKGMLILDAKGRFMLTIIGADLPKFASNSRASGTSEENKAVITRSVAFFGTYSMTSGNKELVFKIEDSTFPNWDATEQKRSVVTLSRDELKYVVAQASSGGTGTVTWKRVK